MFGRCFLGFWIATLLCAAATAAPVGSNHPSAGAYSPVDESSWGSASWPLGATFTSGAGSTLQVAVYSANATNVVLEIYLDAVRADAAYDYTMAKGPDNIWRAAIAQVPVNTLYAFRAWGPNWTFDPTWTRGNSTAGFHSDCDSLGNRFNPNKVLFDPYARELSHSRDGAAMKADGENGGMYGTGGTDIASGQTYKGAITGGVAINRRNVDTGHYAPKGVVIVDATPTGTRPDLPQKDALIYETHLKGLSAHPSSVDLTTLLSSYSGFQDAANVPDALRGTYAGAAYMAGYLRDLGFNTVEFLPIHETNNETSPTTSSGGNYWGYSTYGFFAPDRRYASNRAFGGPTAEFKAMVAAFHRAGLEVYLDVVYNHSGEGGTWDSTGECAELTFFRGLDNRSYYTPSSSSALFYSNRSGVGNDLNCGSTPVQQLVLDSLAYWNQTMGVDGFRFDVGVEMGRNGNSNFSSTSPMLVSIASLAAANAFKIVAEPWDLADGNEIGNFPAGWGCWNGNYRDTVRNAMIGSLSTANGTGYIDAFHGSYNQFAKEGGPQKSVNYVVCHDGFTITDQVSFTAPTQSTLTWPFGPSDGGSTSNRSSNWNNDQTLRRQVIRSFWAFELLSRGVPMMVWGDELGRTVNGNNNAYNVDSVATWNNYAMLGTNHPDAVPTGDATPGSAPYYDALGTFATPNNGNFTFLQYLLHLRAAHPAFRQDNYNETITYTNPDGSGGFSQSNSLTPAIYVAGSQVQDDDFFIMANLSGSAVNYTIPTAPSGTHWARLVDTNNANESVANCWPVATATAASGSYSVGNKTLVVLEAVRNVVAPTITTQPISQTVAPGGTLVLTAATTGATTFQWQKDGAALVGATNTTLTLSNVSAAASGNYTLVATNAAGSTTSATATVLVDTPNPGRLVNLSVRSFAGTGDQTLIAGFALRGGGARPLLVRGIGPTLTLLQVPSVLPDPMLQVMSGQTPIATNDNWGGTTALANLFPQVGAFGLPSGSLDAALVFTPTDGTYTAQITDASGATGIALAEVYDAARNDSTLPRLVNVSARTQVDRDANILIAGFGISGNVPMPVLIRGIGPGLIPLGVNAILMDPKLQIFDANQVKIAENDNWSDAPNDATSMTAAFNRVGAFPLTVGSHDAALVITLPPGTYTAQVSGVDRTTGVALVEVYELPAP